MRSPSSQPECRVRWGVPMAAQCASGLSLKTRGGVWVGRHIHTQKKYVSIRTRGTGAQILALSVTTAWPWHGT